MEEHAVQNFVRQKVEWLDRDTAQSRAMCAHLRRGIGKPPGDVPALWEITLADAPGDWRSYRGEPSYAQYAVHTALTLYALHRQGKTQSMCAFEKTDGHSFGGAAARLVRRDENRLDAVKRRFNAAATAAVFTELAQHARGLIQLMRAESEPIRLDYPRFALDLFVFQHPGRADGIRLRWGEDFYRVLSGKEKERDEGQS
ncbi:MAG: type I-E CRISPR-associated protein Cse2/CasB [Clostridiales bacterium]|jgi:CRISPR system Cascade subunit CasB|nr:type I-E CRISPR-associated protein Cse2/CasB [Clostridiales bacterium]